MASPTRPRVLVLEDEWLVADQIESALVLSGYGDVELPAALSGRPLSLAAH